MNESSCCGNKSHPAGSTNDKESSCCSNEHMSAGSVLDPVCGMKVDPSKAELYAVHKGKKYYFCNSNCRNSFVSDPEKYLSKTI